MRGLETEIRNEQTGILREDRLAATQTATRMSLHDLLHEGFDPGSELTLAAWLRHASRTAKVARPCKWRKGE